MWINALIKDQFIFVRFIQFARASFLFFYLEKIKYITTTQKSTQSAIMCIKYYNPVKWQKTHMLSKILMYYLDL